MGRRLRLFFPDRVYHITNRCAEGRLLLRPDGKLNALVEYWLVHSLELYGVELFAYCFMGNHFHLLIRAPRNNLSKFMGYFQSRLSGAVKSLRGWDPSLFPERFRDVPCLDEATVLSTFAYCMLNPVRAGLVDHPAAWPGHSSAHQLLDPSTPGSIALTPLPGWEDLSLAERADRVRRLLGVDAPAASARGKRRARRSLRVARLRRQHCTRAIALEPRGPRPWCHASDRATELTYRDAWRETRRLYSEALDAWRRGEPRAFPPGTHPPGWLYPVMAAAARSS